MVEVDQMNKLVDALQDITDELNCAINSYPAPNPNMASLSAVVGELADAMYTEGNDHVYAEACRVAAKAIRIMLEGDPYVDLYREGIGLKPTSDRGQIDEVVKAAVAHSTKYIRNTAYVGEATGDE